MDTRSYDPWELWILVVKEPEPAYIVLEGCWNIQDSGKCRGYQILLFQNEVVFKSKKELPVEYGLID